MTPATLQRENQVFAKTGGVSGNNRREGFCSAFLDTVTDCVHLSRFADGRPAPMHLLDGLPDELVAARDERGRIVAIRENVVAGFLRAGRFYNRQQAAEFLTTDSLVPLPSGP